MMRISLIVIVAIALQLVMVVKIFVSIAAELAFEVVIVLHIDEGKHKCEACISVYTRKKYCLACEQLIASFHTVFMVVHGILYLTASNMKMIFLNSYFSYLHPFKRFPIKNWNGFPRVIEILWNHASYPSVYEGCEVEVVTSISYPCKVTAIGDKASEYFRLIKNRVYEINVKIEVGRAIGYEVDFIYQYEYEALALQCNYSA